jgi:streptogramin lyase
MLRIAARLIALALVAAWAAPPARADVIVADFAGMGISRYNETTGAAGSPIVPLGGGATGLGFPAGITFGPDGNLYVSSQSMVVSGVTVGTDAIFRINPTTGAATTFIPLATGYAPAGLRFGPDGSLYVSHSLGQNPPLGSGTVDHYNGTTGALLGSVITGLTQPTGLLVTSTGDVYASSFLDHSVVRYNGTTQSTVVAAGAGGLVGPSGLAFGPDGNLYVVDLLGAAVRRYSPTGTALGNLISGGQLTNNFPSDLLFDRQGTLLVANLGPDFAPPPNAHGTVMRFDATTGAFLSTFASGLVSASQLALTPVPEPGSPLLLAGAAGAFAAYSRRRRAKQ